MYTTDVSRVLILAQKFFCLEIPFTLTELRLLTSGSVLDQPQTAKIVNHVGIMAIRFIMANIILFVRLATTKV